MLYPAISNGDAYKLDVGDKIKIQVYGDNELSLEASVDEDGAIVYPYMGKIKVLHLTLAQLEQQITTFLKGDYLLDPIVDVSVQEYRPFFLQGAVKTPGKYTYQPGLTVQSAISLGGGLAERASKRKIYILHANTKEGDRIKVELHDKVVPGDIIVVEESFF